MFITVWKTSIVRRVFRNEYFTYSKPVLVKGLASGWAAIKAAAANVSVIDAARARFNQNGFPGQGIFRSSASSRPAAPAAWSYLAAHPERRADARLPYWQDIPIFQMCKEPTARSQVVPVRRVVRFLS